MSVNLSHRRARVALQPPIVDLPRGERHALWLACERGTEFAALPAAYQQLILEAEAARERAIAEQRAAVGR